MSQGVQQEVGVACRSSSRRTDAAEPCAPTAQHGHAAETPRGGSRHPQAAAATAGRRRAATPAARDLPANHLPPPRHASPADGSAAADEDHLASQWR